MINKSAALYFGPESIGADEGAQCAICWKFNREDKACVEVEGFIEPMGVCGLYVHGSPAGGKFKVSVKQVSKAEAGYTDNGPTHCRSCEYMLVPKLYSESRCAKVDGMIDGRGCCSLWEKR